jgi:hypothetical protein
LEKERSALLESKLADALIKTIKVTETQIEINRKSLEITNNFK